MSALAQRLRNAARPGAWSDPKTFIEAAERIEELEAKLLALTEEKLESALSKVPEPKNPVGRPRKKQE